MDSRAAAWGREGQVPLAGQAQGEYLSVAHGSCLAGQGRPCQVGTAPRVGAATGSALTSVRPQLALGERVGAQDVGPGWKHVGEIFFQSSMCPTGK